MPEKPRPDPLHEWARRHDDEWIGQHPIEVVSIGGAIGLALVGWWAYTHEARLLLWARGHALPLIVGAFLVLAAVAEVVWTITHRQKHGKITKEWPGLAKGLGLEGAKIVGRESDKSGQTLKLQLNRFAGQATPDVVSKLPRLEAAVKAHPGRVRVIPDKTRADLCSVRIDKTDPLAKAIPWPGSRMESVKEPMVLGTFGDTWPVTLSLWTPERQQHVLIGGVNGAGKSGLINVALANLAPCRDLAIWGVDMKGGMELAPWRTALDQLATTPREARALLERANGILDERMATLAAERSRRWTPAPATPLLLVVVDELSELDQDCLTLVLRIARMGRAPGVQLLLATQRPSAKQLEAKDESGAGLRGQMHTRITMRVTEAREVDMILGTGYRSEGFSADRILGPPGTFLLVSPPEHVEPRPARAFHMTDEDVQKAVETAQLARLNSDTELQPELRAPATEDERLLAMLEEAGDAGMKAVDIAAAFNHEKVWAFRHLKKLAAEGKVASDKAGLWRRVA